MTPKPRRPIAGSRTPSGAPKKIAGRGRAAPTPAEASSEGPHEVVEPIAPVEPEAGPESSAPEPAASPPVDEPDTSVAVGEEPTAPRSTLLSRSTTTRVLVSMLVVLAVVGAVEVYLLAKDPLQPTDDRPVAVSELDTQLAVDDATRQLTEILEFSWRDYDEQTEDALSLIEDGEFKDEYEQTAADTRSKVLEQKAEYSVEVLGSGVIEAGPDEVTTLVFLNQIVFRGQGQNRVGPDVYPFRIEVTTVRDGDRWLVAEITPR